MKQPSKSAGMSLRLLFLWIGHKFKQTYKNLWNTLQYKIRLGGKSGIAVQGELAKRLHIDGRYLELKNIVEIAQQSQNDNDDIFFDYQAANGASLTIRLFRAKDQQSLIVEVLPESETNGVFIKQTGQQGLLEELKSTFTANDRGWFEVNNYRYTPW